jgi:hypothetical protein
MPINPNWYQSQVPTAQPTPQPTFQPQQSFLSKFFGGAENIGKKVISAAPKVVKAAPKALISADKAIVKPVVDLASHQGGQATHDTAQLSSDVTGGLLNQFAKGVQYTPQMIAADVTNNPQAQASTQKKAFGTTDPKEIAKKIAASTAGTASLFVGSGEAGAAAKGGESVGKTALKLGTAGAAGNAAATINQNPNATKKQIFESAALGGAAGVALPVVAKGAAKIIDKLGSKTETVVPEEPKPTTPEPKSTSLNQVEPKTSAIEPKPTETAPTTEPSVNAEGKNVGGTPIYHGTTPEIAKQIEKSGFDVKKSADGTIWFTDNPKIGEVAASGKGGVVKRLIDENKLKLGGWNETDKYGTQELINQGYDGLKLKDGNETTYQIFNPEKLSKPIPPKPTVALSPETQLADHAMKFKTFGGFIDNAKTQDLVAKQPDLTVQQLKDIHAKALEPREVPIAEEKPVGVVNQTPGTSKIGASIQENAVAKGLEDNFGESAKYGRVDIADQAQKAVALTKDPELLNKVINGEAPIPTGLRATSIITAVEKDPVLSKDPELLNRLSQAEHLVGQSTYGAQELRLAAERSANSPITHIKNLRDIRAAAKGGVEKVNQAVKKTTADIRTNVKPPTRQNWNDFVNELRCT